MLVEQKKPKIKNVEDFYDVLHVWDFEVKRFLNNYKLVSNSIDCFQSISIGSSNKLIYINDLRKMLEYMESILTVLYVEMDKVNEQLFISKLQFQAETLNDVNNSVEKIFVSIDFFPTA